jgi:hypothetical protein
MFEKILKKFLLATLIISSCQVIAKEISLDNKTSDEISIENEKSDEKSEDNAHSNIHGLVDIVFKNDYITPRGLLVSNTGLTLQVLVGLTLDVYKDSNRYINAISINMGVWNDIWTDQHSPEVGSWNELDWFIGLTMAIKKNWILQMQFIEFLSPPGHFTPENNAEFTLLYNDSSWKLPLTFNPYIKLFWAISGDSTVVVGKPGGTYYIELGMVPTIEFDKGAIPVNIAFPTWFSMGPACFWNGGKLALKNIKSNLGVFSTGLKGSIPLQIIPNSFGHWYIDIGMQYYYLINDNLLQAQLFTINVPSIKSSKRNIGVGFIGLGFTF